MDATIDWLTGAHILKAERKGMCIELEREDGQRAILGDRVVYGELMCLTCRDDRHVEVVQTAGQREGFCNVCSRSWKLG